MAQYNVENKSKEELIALITLLMVSQDSIHPSHWVLDGSKPEENEWVKTARYSKENETMIILVERYNEQEGWVQYVPNPVDLSDVVCWTY